MKNDPIILAKITYARTEQSRLILLSEFSREYPKKWQSFKSVSFLPYEVPKGFEVIRDPQTGRVMHIVKDGEAYMLYARSDDNVFFVNAYGLKAPLKRIG